MVEQLLRRPTSQGEITRSGLADPVESTRSDTGFSRDLLQRRPEQRDTVGPWPHKLAWASLVHAESVCQVLGDCSLNVSGVAFTGLCEECDRPGGEIDLIPAKRE